VKVSPTSPSLSQTRRFQILGPARLPCGREFPQPEARAGIRPWVQPALGRLAATWPASPRSSPWPRPRTRPIKDWRSVAEITAAGIQLIEQVARPHALVVGGQRQWRLALQQDRGIPFPHPRNAGTGPPDPPPRNYRQRIHARPEDKHRHRSCHRHRALGPFQSRGEDVLYALDEHGQPFQPVGQFRWRRDRNRCRPPCWK